MAFDRQHGNLVWACDDAKCSATFEAPDALSFEQAWADAKADGWKARKIAGEWLHFCPECEP